MLAGGILLPLLRSEPEPVHEFIVGLKAWQRIGFISFLAILFTFVLFKLLAPRPLHLRHATTHPPAWVGVVLGVICVAVVDLTVGLDPEGYPATAWEWLGYAGGSVLLVGAYCGTWKELFSLCRRRNRDAAEEGAESTPHLSLQNIGSARWEDIEAWLQSDAPADYDFLGNRAVANRLGTMLIDGTRSIGVVGPYGAGKTSLVSWIIERIAGPEPQLPKFFVCHHSCWGFETSASAIHDMLSEAVQKVGEEIDTFHVDSLPESYRQTFSAGGDWIDAISKLVLRSHSPMDQFGRLSQLLSDLNGQLVFIVEDLDRNETRNFEVQEVLAFLERLKKCRNISFILTGGQLSSRQIDFAKLCDHFERLRTIQPRHLSPLVLRVRERCLDQDVFCHEVLGDPDRQYDWSPLSGLMMRDYDEFSFSQAVAALLNTPRSLRHVLGRTYFAWRRLFGEIDLDQLLAVNVLRFGAPECFHFLDRRWDRLHAPPSQDPSFGRERIEHIRQAIIDDWNNTIRNVEWNPVAALKVMEEILPATEYWLIDSSRSGRSGDTPQGVHQERYWLRAINEVIDEDDVRDQDVIRQTRQWMEAPSADAELISSLTSSSQFSDIWEDLAGRLLSDQPDRILQVCEHVLNRILLEHGAAASHDSQGFVATWRFANRRIPRRAENRAWLEARISEAASISVEMVNSLWHYYGTPGRYSLLQSEDTDAVRQHEVHELQSVLVDGEALGRIISPQYPYVLYQLVFDPGDHNPHSVGEIPTWTWLAPVLLDALRLGNAVVAVGVATLVASRESGSRREPWAVDPSILFAFFPDDAQEVVNLMSDLSSQIEAADQQQIVNAIVESSRMAIQERTAAIEDGEGGADQV